MKAVKSGILAAAVFGAAALLAGPASAESVTQVIANQVAEPQSIAVSYDDLDLTSAAGQETLHYRLANAAREACGSSDWKRVGSLAVASRNQSCYEESLSRAMSDIPTTQVAATR